MIDNTLSYCWRRKREQVTPPPGICRVFFRPQDERASLLAPEAPGVKSKWYYVYALSIDMLYDA